VTPFWEATLFFDPESTAGASFLYLETLYLETPRSGSTVDGLVTTDPLTVGCPRRRSPVRIDADVKILSVQENPRDPEAETGVPTNSKRSI
jgi:hypothetical protein